LSETLPSDVTDTDRCIGDVAISGCNDVDGVRPNREPWRPPDVDVDDTDVRFDDGVDGVVDDDGAPPPEGDGVNGKGVVVGPEGVSDDVELSSGVVSKRVMRGDSIKERGGGRPAAAGCTVSAAFLAAASAMTVWASR
jgi:hypothetical protein